MNTRDTLADGEKFLLFSDQASQRGSVDIHWLGQATHDE
jgi:hypothetical protein